MPMYALATIPLIRKLRTEVSEVRQVWYADDASGVGTIHGLKEWWEHLSSLSPMYGYHLNAVKTRLITKQELYADAESVFKDTYKSLHMDDHTLVYHLAQMSTKAPTWLTRLNSGKAR